VGRIDCHAIALARAAGRPAQPSASSTAPVPGDQLDIAIRR